MIVQSIQYEPIAKEIAYKVHKNQFRRDGITSYIVHPKTVAENFKDDVCKSIAWLHDVLEDSTITENDLLKEGISVEIVFNVVMLTKTKNLSYNDYIKRITHFEKAKAVKLADISHNYKTATLKQKNKYDKAIKILKTK